MPNADIKLIRYGGSTRLVARHTNGATLEIVISEGAERGYSTRAVIDASGRIVWAFGGSWPLSGAEPKVVTDSRKLIELAEIELAGACAR